MSPKLDTFLIQFMRTKAGRHKIWHAWQYPWMNKRDVVMSILDEDAFNAGDPIYIKRIPPQFDGYTLMPEDELWAMVFAKAKEWKVSRLNAFKRMAFAPFERSLDPPHPFAVKV